MVDIPGDASTGATLTVGGSVIDTIEVNGDHDWFRISLTAGQAITVSLNSYGSGGLSDPYLRIRDSSGTEIFHNDDGGGTLNSRLSFSAPSTGTYYIDVGGFDDQASGAYQVSVAPFTPPPTGTPNQFADQLVSDYWGGTSHHFMASQGGSITVNVTALAVAGQGVARQALTTWSEIIGVRFVEVASGGQIIFDDSADGAATSGSWSGGLTTSESVNISTQWLTDYGTAIGTYGYQTYLHEIGHALGLGHAGMYNDTAGYPYDAKFANDSWAMTVMSYFDQRENTVTSGLGYSKAYLGTPMIADLIAMQRLYGLSTTTRTGDTVYGIGSTAGNPAYDASANPNLAYTIFDSGGIDTINYSGIVGSQRIDLIEGAYSNVGGRSGNVAIAFGTVIENAVGGSGSDTLIGNAADNILTGGPGSDTLTGGGGADVFRDTAAGLNGDTITDFSRSDRINITNANAGSFSASFSSGILTYTGGSVTLSSMSSGRVSVSAAASGLQLAILANTVANDFNGDGRSDILWRNDNGTVTNWTSAANGSFVDNDVNLFRSVPASWHVMGSGDFNGDGRTDILWRNDGGAVTDWLATAGGGAVSNDANLYRPVPSTWQIIGTGDFNGDGRSDILWRNDNGVVTDWLATAAGGMNSNDAALFTSVPSSWRVMGTGDFNGDGRVDILWRNDGGVVTDWIANANGGFAGNDASIFRSVPLSWHIVGTGDFNGDGRGDILWRNDNGDLTDWLANTSGGFVSNDSGLYRNVVRSWHVAGIGDVNGDGRSDILWRNDNGSVTDWLANASGGFADNDSVFYRSVSVDWHIQSADIMLV